MIAARIFLDGKMMRPAIMETIHASMKKTADIPNSPARTSAFAENVPQKKRTIPMPQMKLPDQ